MRILKKTTYLEKKGSNSEENRRKKEDLAKRGFRLEYSKLGDPLKQLNFTSPTQKNRSMNSPKQREGKLPKNSPSMGKMRLLSKQKGQYDRRASKENHQLSSHTRQRSGGFEQII